VTDAESNLGADCAKRLGSASSADTKARVNLMKKQEGVRGFGLGLWGNGLFGGGAGSAEKGTHGFGLDQFTRLIQVIHDHRVRVNAQRMVHGGHDLGRVDRGLGGRGSGGI